MRSFIGVSILALSFAFATGVQADEAWFRITMPSPTYFDVNSSEMPDENLEIDVDPHASGRIYGELLVPVVVSGIDDSYSVEVEGLPSGAEWVPDPETYGVGTVSWTSAAEGTYDLAIEVRDANGDVIATQHVELIIHPELTASVPETSYEVDVDGDLTITPDVHNAIGSILWGATPSPLPEWLSLDVATGEIEVDTSEPNEETAITLTAVDQADMFATATSPFSIAVAAATFDYWIATLDKGPSDHGYGVDVAADGSIYVTGTVGVNSDRDFLVAKYDVHGALLWKRALNAGGQNEGYDVAVSTDGSVYAVGNVNGDLLLVKYNASGTLQWKETLGSGYLIEGLGVSVGSDGSVYIAGSTQSSPIWGSHLLVAKYAANGVLQWSESISGDEDVHGNDIAVSPDGFIYVTGDVEDSDGYIHALVAKYNTSGLQQWVKVFDSSTAFGGLMDVYGYDLDVASDGSVYMVGRTIEPELLLAKIEPDGDLQWKKGLSTWSGKELFDHKRPAVKVAADGSIYVVSDTGLDSVDSPTLLVSSFDASGNLEWAKAFQDDNYYKSSDIALAADGSIYVTGSAPGDSLLLLHRLPVASGAVSAEDEFVWSGLSSGVFAGGISLRDGDLSLNSQNADVTEGDGNGVAEKTDFTLTDGLIELQLEN